MAEKRKVLFILPRGEKNKKDYIARRIDEEAGSELVCDIATTREEVKNPEEYEILVSFFHPWLKEMIPCMGKLRWIHFLSAGVDTIWEWGLHEKELLMSKSTGVHAINISEHVMGMVLYFSRRFHLYFHQQLEAKWKSHGGDEVWGRTMGIVGLGHIGRECARKARCFGMKVIGSMRNPRSVEEVDAVYGPDELFHILKESDFLIVAVPLTPDTRHLMSTEEFKKMKRTAYLINVGRGNVVHEEALLQALKQGEIAGAGLDVFAREPLPASSPLWQEKNVLITPHVAGPTPRYMERAVTIFLQNWQNYRADKPLQTAVDLEKGY